MYKDEISRASSALSRKKIRIHRVLESLMGDPILSHWIGADGIVAGTALGRVSAYLFDCLVLGDSQPSKLESVSSKNCGYDELQTPENETTMEPRNGQDDEIVSSGRLADQGENVSDHGEDEQTSSLRSKDLRSLAQNDVIVEIKEDMSPRGNEMPAGKYTVFATFSDEPVYAAFIHNRLLYCMIGTSSICIYDVDAYSLKEEYGLQLSRSTGYKQVLFSDSKVLIESVRGSTIVDPVVHKQSITYERLCPCNILDFNGSMMVCYGKSEYYNVMVFCMDQTTLDSKQMFSVPLPKRVHLVTHGKFWGHGKIVVVCDLLEISVFNYLDNLTTPVVKTKTRADIVDVCCGFPSFLILLTKDAKISLLHQHTLEVFYSLSVFPATFEIGWPYTIINHENILSFTADDGVYCLELPQEVHEFFNK